MAKENPFLLLVDKAEVSARWVTPFLAHLWTISKNLFTSASGIGVRKVFAKIGRAFSNCSRGKLNFFIAPFAGSGFATSLKVFSSVLFNGILSPCNNCKATSLALLAVV